MNKRLLAALSLVFSFALVSMVSGQADGNTGAYGALIGIILAIFFVFLAIAIGLYIYMSLAYMGIGRRAGDRLPGLAWIPGIGPALIVQRASGMHWWPFLLIVLQFVAAIVFMVYGFSTGGLLDVSTAVDLAGTQDFGIYSHLPAAFLAYFLVSILIGVTFMVYYIIWHWKAFEALGRPGWWPLLAFLLMVVGGLIPLIGIVPSLAGLVLWLVFIGIAAWGKPPQQGGEKVMVETSGASRGRKSQGQVQA